MADDLKRAQKALLDKGKELAKTDEGKRFLALMLATRQEVEPYVPPGYARDIRVKDAGKAAGVIDEARRIYFAIKDLNSEDAVKYANKGINKLLKKIDPETTIKLSKSVKGEQRVIRANRKIGPGVFGTTFAGDKLDLSGFKSIDYDTPEYGVSVNPQRRTARGRYNVGPVDATAFVDPRAGYGRAGVNYRAGDFAGFDTTLTGAGDTSKNFRVGANLTGSAGLFNAELGASADVTRGTPGFGATARLSADTSKITDYFLEKQKPFGKAKGGAVKKYAKGGGVRRPKLK